MISGSLSARAHQLARTHFQSVMALTIRGLSVLAGFALSFIIGHRFGPEANGTYALATQSAMFLSVIAVGGLDLAVVRQFSASMAYHAKIAASTIIKVVACSIGFASILVLMLLMGGPMMLQWVVGAALPSGVLFILCIILVSRALTRIGSSILRSQKRYIMGQSIEVLLIPVVVLAAISAGLATDIGPILWVTAIASATVAGLGIVLSLNGASLASDAVKLPISPMMRIAMPLWGVAIALNVADWYGLVVVANVSGVYEAGLYRVAAQIGTSFAIVSMGLFSVFSPQISASWAREDGIGVARLGRTATRLSAIFTIPPAIIILAIAEPLLALIGPEFVSAATMLRIIVVGQIMYTITGPAGLTLAMTGHERVNLVITITSTLCLFAIAPLAAHEFGPNGVAGCIAILLVTRNLVSLYLLKRLAGIDIIRGKFDCSIDHNK